MYRSETGNPPEAFDEVDEEGGEVAVTDESSPVDGSSVTVPEGALDSEQPVVISVSSDYFGSPDGRVPVGPAVDIEIGPGASLSADVTITIQFSERLVEFFRKNDVDVEVWKYDGGWINVPNATITQPGSVSVQTDSLSPFQAWLEFPEDLLLDTLVGGEDGCIEYTPDQNLSHVNTVTTGPNQMIGGKFGNIYYVEYDGRAIDVFTYGLNARIVGDSPHPEVPVIPERGWYTGIAEGVDGQNNLSLYFGTDPWGISIPQPPGGVAWKGGLINKIDLVTRDFERIAGVTSEPYFDPGSDGVPATEVLLGVASGIAVDGDDIYFTESNVSYPDPFFGLPVVYSKVRRIDSSGIVHTVAGVGEAGFDPDIVVQQALDVKLYAPTHPIVVTLKDGKKLLFFIDKGNHRVRAVNISGETIELGSLTILDGQIVTVMGNIFYHPSEQPTDCSDLHVGLGFFTTLVHPVGLAYAEDILFVSDSCHRVLAMSLYNFYTTTVAGVAGDAGFNNDGFAGINSRLNYPKGLVFDPDYEHLYIADNKNLRIRKLHFGESDSEVLDWLDSNPTVANEMVWEGACGDISYNDWPSYMKNGLRFTYQRSKDWHTSGMTGPDPLKMNAPPNNIYPDDYIRPCVPSGEPGSTVVTKLSTYDAWKIYLSHSAWSLFVEIQGLVPWSVVDFKYEESLESLFDSTRMFNRTGNYLYMGYEIDSWELGNILPTAPTRIYEKLGRYLDSSSDMSAVFGILEWSKDNIKAFHSCSWGNLINHFDYEGFPPVEKMIDGTVCNLQYCSPGQQCPNPCRWEYRCLVSDEVTHFSSGCGSSSGLMRLTLWTVNVPSIILGAMPIPEGRAGHKQLHFPELELFLPDGGAYLVHGDDPYSIIFEHNVEPTGLPDPSYVDTPLSIAELLVDNDTYYNWFGVDDRQMCKWMYQANVGRNMQEVGIRNKTNYALKTFCWDLHYNNNSDFHSTIDVLSYDDCKTSCFCRKLLIDYLHIRPVVDMPEEYRSSICEEYYSDYNIIPIIDDWPTYIEELKTKIMDVSGCNLTGCDLLTACDLVWYELEPPQNNPVDTPGSLDFYDILCKLSFP